MVTSDRYGPQIMPDAHTIVTTNTIGNTKVPSHIMESQQTYQTLEVSKPPSQINSTNEIRPPEQYVSRHARPPQPPPPQVTIEP